MNVALLTAAGSGTRMQLNIPKQFIHVDDKPIIIYTMEAFQNHPSIDAIIVVTIDSWSDVLWACKAVWYYQAEMGGSGW
jgi:2-C-methyl-D-erythritol 4-phosphate cytidylyltransferase